MSWESAPTLGALKPQYQYPRSWRRCGTLVGQSFELGSTAGREQLKSSLGSIEDRATNWSLDPI